MPTYAYACKQCGHRFDAVQSFADPALTECPVCGGELKKEYGSIGVTFNGSGFYRTDSRAAGSGSDGGSKGESGGGDSGSKSDTPQKSGGGESTSPPSSNSSPSSTPAPSTP